MQHFLAGWFVIKGGRGKNIEGVPRPLGEDGSVIHLRENEYLKRIGKKEDG